MLLAAPAAGLKLRQYDEPRRPAHGPRRPALQAAALEVLPRLSLLDPACGSGAFLVAAMKTLINVYAAVIGRIQFVSDRT